MTVVRHGWTQVVGAAAVVFTVCAGLSAVAAQDAKVEAQGAQAGPGIWGGVYTDDQHDRILRMIQTNIAAYVLKLNKYPAGQAELATDVSALKQIIIEGQPPAK